jgi:hypothetical protein
MAGAAVMVTAMAGAMVMVMAMVTGDIATSDVVAALQEPCF